jgi:hypothetical protein
MEIHGIPAGQKNSQVLVQQVNFGHHGVGLIGEFPPPVFIYPGKLSRHPDSQAAIFPADVIFLAHMGVKEIPDIVVLVKTNQESAVSHRKVAGHDSLLYWQ